MNAKTLFPLLREKIGVNQYEMADLLEISQSSVAAYETGNRVPSR